MTRFTGILGSATMAGILGGSALAEPPTYVADPEHGIMKLVDPTTNGFMSVFPARRVNGITAPTQHGEIRVSSGTDAFATADVSITIDFDTFPDGTAVPEGTGLTDQYATVGAVFSVADTSNPPSALVVDDASSDGAMFVGMSPPNILGFFGFSPGPHAGLGCASDLRVDFVDSITQLPTTVNAASILVFAVADTDRLLHLVARDANGGIVDQDEIIIRRSDVTSVSVFTLGVCGPGNIASIETDRATGSFVCMAFDNLVITPVRRCSADLSGDGKVDLVDFGMFQAEFTGP